MLRSDPTGRAQRIRDALTHRADVSEGSRSESSSGRAAPVDVDQVIARVESLAHHFSEDEFGDQAAFKKALDTLIDHGAPALKKLFGAAASTELSASELNWTEAVILADGSRPSLLLTEGGFNPDHPFLGKWRDEMTAFQPALRGLAGCVGRLQPPSGGPANYNGTGALVDVSAGLVLTNFHVVQHARAVSGVAMEPDVQPGLAGRLKVTGDWVIDFAGESRNPARNRWLVKEVRLPMGVGESFTGLDAAVLQIEPFGPESKRPGPGITLSADPDYAIGSGNTTLVTVGYPGEPDIASAPAGSVDWKFVIHTLFNNRFGVKRVAPGQFRTAAGSVPDDPFGRVLTHDATTFGGASGSPVFAWKDEGTPSFALHFAGATLTDNYAVSLHKAADALRATGLPFA